MQSIIKRFLNIFLVIVCITAVLALAGIGYSWWGLPADQADRKLPYLDWLIGSFLVEIIAISLAFMRSGTKYLPKVHHTKTSHETVKFMSDFFTSGSSVTVVSNRLGWMMGAPEIVSIISNRIKGGASFEFITTQPIPSELAQRLEGAGAKLICTHESVPPEARFTLINGHRSGAERLAIARGTHPDHEITVFDNDSGPQMIGMAKDVIRKSKELQRAESLE